MKLLVHFYAPMMIIRGIIFCLCLPSAHPSIQFSVPPPEFSRNQFETEHRCYQPLENVHGTLKMKKQFFTNFNLNDLDDFEVRLQFSLASLCNQLLPEFSSNQFETLHRCYEHN